MWIKICATTNLEDALLAADSGADAVGFVFAPSPRRVTAAQVAEIVPSLPPGLQKIGIFSTQDFDDIAFVLQTAGLGGVQLHGELDFLLTDRLRKAFGSDFFLIQTLHWHVNRDPAQAEAKLRQELRAMARHGALDAILVDARTTSAAGGTGRTFDWERARHVLEEEGGDLRIVVAGGLHPANVGEAIRTLQPWGVDVASGVEFRPGRKDPSTVRAFVAAARSAFAAVQIASPLTGQST